MEYETGWLKEEVLGEDEARKELAYKSGIPFVVLAREDISPESLLLVPEPLSRARNIIAYRHGDGVVEVALLDISDLGAVDFLKPGMKVKARLTSRDSLKRALLLYQKQLKEKFSGLVERGIEAADSLLRHALQNNATHIHLEPSAAAMLVRYRINGILHEAMRLPEHASEFIQQRIKSLAKLFPVTTTAQEGRFKIDLPAQTGHRGGQVTVSVSTVPGVAGEKMLLRLAREEHGQRGFTLSGLGFHGGGLERVHELLRRRRGLVVVSGPSESGTTTTLYTLLDELNHPGIAVSTIEEKVEYVLPHVAQMQTRSDMGLGLLAGLRAVLRTDPDVVMVSDIGRREVAELAARAAARGVFVLAGMKAKSPSKVLDLLSPAVPRAIINQRLVRKLCQECNEAYRPGREELEPFAERANFGHVLAALKEEDVVGQDKAWKEIDFYKPKGCDACEDGYRGRLGVQEILEENAEGLTLIEDGLFKAAQRLTSVEEVVYLAQ